MSVEFCDTNIFVYAYDLEAGGKRERALDLTARLWRDRVGATSVQVLQELFSVLTRKLKPALPAARARQIIVDTSLWQVSALDANDVVVAVDIASRHVVSVWDACIIVAAVKAGATTIWSEDLGDGVDYGGVTVRNPFR